MPGNTAVAHFHQPRKHANRIEEGFFQLALRQFQKRHGLPQFAGSLFDQRLQPFVELAQFDVLFFGQRQKARVFTLETALLQRLPHRQHDFVVVPGLGDIAVDFALVDGGDGGADIGITREQDAHGIRPALTHLT